MFAAVLGHPYGPSEERGIYRSTDGGQNWQKVISKDENTGGSDVEIDPANPDVVYASMWEAREGPWEDGNEFNGAGGGLFKSTDGGSTWHQLTNGLPKDLAQIYVAIAPSDSRRLYATLAQASGKLSVYRSDDAGDSWAQITTDPRPAGRIGGGDLSIPKVDPKNPDLVYGASTVTMRSSDGGKTWTGFRGAPGGDDYQNLWINPNNGNIILLVSDQGAIVTVNAGATWSSWYNQPTAQLYHAITDNTFPYRVCAGQQESGSVCISSRGNDGEITFRDWHPVGVIEYGYVAPDPLDPDIIYGGGRSEVSKFHWSTAQVQIVTPIPLRNPKYRTDRTEPLMFSPVDPHILYFASNVLFKTTDGGNSWQTISPDLTRENPGVPASVGTLVPKGAEKQRGVIYALAPSFKNRRHALGRHGRWPHLDHARCREELEGHHAEGTDGVEQGHADLGIAFRRADGVCVGEPLPHRRSASLYLSHARWRQDLEADHHGPARLRPGRYGARRSRAQGAAVRGHGEHRLGFVRRRRPLAVAAIESAAHVHARSVDSRQRSDRGDARALVLDSRRHRAAARGSAAIANAVHLFKPAPAYRVQRDTNTDTPLPPDEPMAANPPDGAILDYFLPAAASTVTLEIQDSQERVVRRYSNTDKPDISEDELQKQLIPLYWVRKQQHLSTAAGMHRFRWDLHYPSPTSTRHDYPISAIPHDTPRYPLGPTALPGSYTVRLTVDGKTSTAPLTIKMDPRVKTSVAGLAKKFQAETRWRPS